MDLYIIRSDTGQLVEKTIATSERQAWRQHFMWYLEHSGVTELSDHVVYNLQGQAERSGYRCISLELTQETLDELKRDSLG